MSIKVFIVDDDQDVSEFYTNLLRLAGHRVVGCAINGLDAIEKYEEIAEKPDVIIMDHRMPVMDGLESSRRILEIDPEARIIFASADVGVESDARTLGVITFKKKPFTIDRIINNIEKAMNQKKHKVTQCSTHETCDTDAGTQ